VAFLNPFFRARDPVTSWKKLPQRGKADSEGPNPNPKITASRHTSRLSRPRQLRGPDETSTPLRKKGSEKRVDDSEDLAQGEHRKFTRGGHVKKGGKKFRRSTLGRAGYVFRVHYRSGSSCRITNRNIGKSHTIILATMSCGDASRGWRKRREIFSLTTKNVG